MNKRRGFTLIELLVVIAIIALLMSILMPALQRVKNQAQSIKCLANLKQWGLMFKFYTDDNDGLFNQGWDTDSETTLWPNSLRPYYKDNWGLLLCPTATRLMAHEQDCGTFKAAWRDMDLPGGGVHRYNFSYSINSWTNSMTHDRGARLMEWFWKRPDDLGCVEPNTRQRNGKTASANLVPLFADSTWHDGWPRNVGGNEPFLHRQAQRIHQFPFYGLVRQESGAQRELDVEMASCFYYRGAIYKGRRCTPRGLARLAQKL